MEENKKLVPYTSNKAVSKAQQRWDEYVKVAAFIDYLEDIKNSLTGQTKFVGGEYFGWSDGQYGDMTASVPVVEHVYDQGEYQGIYRYENGKLFQAVQSLLALIQEVLKEKNVSIAKLGRQTMTDYERAEKISAILTALSYQFGFANIATAPNVLSIVEYRTQLTDKDFIVISEQAVNEMVYRVRNGYDLLERQWQKIQRRNENQLKDGYYIYWAKLGAAGKKPGGQRPDEGTYQQKLKEIRTSPKPYIHAGFYFIITQYATGYNSPKYSAYQSCARFSYGDWNEIQTHAKTIVEQEMQRFRLFASALQETMRLCDALTRQPGWKQPQIDNLSGLIRILKGYIGQSIEEEQEKTSTPYSPVVESYAFQNEEEEPEPVYEETKEEVTVTVEPEQKPAEPVALEIKSTHTWLGQCIFANKVEPGKFIEVNDTDRQTGMEVIGVSGVGKSSFLENLIYQDIVKGYAVVVLDPHGDLINDVIAQMPGAKVKDTYLLDITDIEYPFGINLFYCENPLDLKERAHVIGRVKGVFEKIFPELEKQQYAPHMLEAIAETFLDNPGHTLGDIPRLLTDRDFRRELIRNVKNRGVKNYWQRYQRLAKGEQEKVSSPLLSKLDEFLLKEFITNIVEQKVTTIDFREAIMERQILLIYLPVEDVAYKLSAELIGTILLSEIYSTTFSFADLSPNERPGFSLYVDEVQNFATSTFAELFDKGRKFGIRQTISHQGLDQLLQENRKAALRAFTKVAFKTSRDDSRAFAEILSDWQFLKRPEHIPYDVFKDLPTHTHDKVRDFADTVVTAMQRRVGKDDELMGTGCLWRWWQQENKIRYTKVSFKEGLQLLGTLLRDAMLHIEVDAIRRENMISLFAYWWGFPNYLLHTYPQFTLEHKPRVNTEYDGDPYLDYTHPISEDILAQEKEKHDRFVNRLDAVIDTLIDKPLGESKSTTDSDREDLLENLEKGRAFAKIGSQSFLLNTFALNRMRTQHPLSEEKRERRKQHILKQTHGKYCKRRVVIEKELAEKEEQIQQSAQEKEASLGEPHQQERPRFEDVE